MSKPTPGADLTTKFIGVIVGNGGKIGSGKLKETLGWSETDFEWVKTSLMGSGHIKMGRGRGGSIQATSTNHPSQKQSPLTPPPAPSTQNYDNNENEPFDLATIKNRYKPVPENINAFTPGMKIVRLATHLYSSEENAWKYMNHYVVTSVKDDKIFVVPKNVKGAEAISTNPVKFYTAK